MFPEAYNKLTNIVLPESLELLCHACAGVAITQQMNAECHLQQHQDCKDVKSAPNAVIIKVGNLGTTESYRTAYVLAEGSV